MSEQKPYVQTYTMVAGSLACNAKCPYCVSQMTPHQGIEKKLSPVNWRNFNIGAKMARDCGASTALITSKGESTLYPDQITEYIEHCADNGFPMIELQTNGLQFLKEFYRENLEAWYKKGLTTISVSIAHYDNERNKEIFTPYTDHAPDLQQIIETLHDIGFSVRVNCTMVKGYVDSNEELENLIQYAQDNGVEQLTVRPMRRPAKSENTCVSDYVDAHAISQEVIDSMREFLDENGTRLRELVHGAIIYDKDGQNICLTDCLTMDSTDDSIRQLIFFPDGHVRYDWQHKGAVLF